MYTHVEQHRSLEIHDCTSGNVHDASAHIMLWQWQFKAASHAAAAVVVPQGGGVPWKEHLFDLEKELQVETPIL